MSDTATERPPPTAPAGPPADPWLKLPPAALWLECSEEQLRKMCRQHRIKYQKFGGLYRFRRSWLQAYLDASTVEAKQ